MQTLSQLTNYRHHNIYVYRTKAIAALKEMRTLHGKQLRTKIVEIPNDTLREEIKKVRIIIKNLNQEIQNAEQTSFAFDGISNFQ